MILLRLLWKPIAALLAVFGIYLAGRKSAKQDAKIKDLQGYRETRERADDADIMGDAPRSLEWLRKRDPEQP